MAHSRLWVATFALCTAVWGLLWLWTLLTPSFEGDLTRVGRLSERAFAARQVQPVIDAALRVNSPLGEADVLVVGDSFSASRMWQSQLVAAGSRVATLHVRETPGFCPQLANWLRQRGFRGHTLVLQTVQRDLDRYLAHAAQCSVAKVRRAGQAEAPLSPGLNAASAPRRSADSLLTGLLTAINTHRALSTSGEQVLKDFGDAERVCVRRMPEGCASFSHRACGWGLFLADDLERPALSPATLAAMEALTKILGAVHVVWAVMPDKSTLYLEPARYAAFGASLQSRRLGPDLLATLMALPGRDIFLPNDTHLSSAAYVRVGQRLLEWMRDGATKTQSPL